MAEALPQPDIGDYAVIGDCRTAALVSRDASIDWLCLPRFDGPSAFGAILDPARGGRFRIAPAGSFETTRRYLPDTNLLETTFLAARGRVRITDGIMLNGGRNRLDPDHEILRRIECIDGEVDVDIICDPRMDYGRVRPRRLDQGSFGFVFDHGSTALVLRSDLPLSALPEGGAGACVRLCAGQRHHVSLASETGRPPVALPLGDAADARIDGTARWWRKWLDMCSYEGPHDALVRRSALTLKLLVFPPSGAIVAAATTSLPERPGGERNWDYRYCWLRDASMTIRALFDLGFTQEGEAFLGWLLHATRLTRPELQVVYDVYGRTDLPERTLDHLSGYRGARPVRIGNAASDQMQLDVYGEVLSAAYEFAARGGRLDEAEASFLTALGGTVCRRWREPDHGIWEVRTERRHFTHSKAMCWVALDRLLRMHDAGHLPLDRGTCERFRRERAAIRTAIETHGVDRARDCHVATFDGTDMDATLLLLGISEFTTPDSPRMHATLEAVRRELGSHGLLHRYSYEDGLSPGEGAFLLCTFWEAELLALQGRTEEACARLEHAAGFANDVGIFSEEVDPVTGAALGNVPQAFTHIGLINAADAVARAEGHAPERRARAPATTHAQSAEEREVAA